MLKKLIDAICFRLINGPLSGPCSPQFVISKLDLKPGDRLVVRFKERISQRQADNLKASLEGQLPKDIKILVFEGDVDLSVLACERLAA